jgi:hypothetical protein
MKQCKKCKETKGMSEFYTHPKMADGHLSFCKPCVRARVSDRYQREHDKVAAYERMRYQRPERKAYVQQQHAKHNLLNPHKAKARQAVSRAVRNGRIQKPTGCPHCGSADRIQAHHHDYSRPLDVSWACFKCHRELYHNQRCAA